jgi:hypothetical protein
MLVSASAAFYVLTFEAAVCIGFGALKKFFGL